MTLDFGKKSLTAACNHKDTIGISRQYFPRLEQYIKSTFVNICLILAVPEKENLLEI